MSAPFVAIITRRGLWEPGEAEPMDHCPLCGADRADDGVCESLGYVLWGFACTWHPGSLILTCNAECAIGTDPDAQRLFRQRVAAFLRPMPPIDGKVLEPYGETATRDTIVAQTSREALRQIIRGAEE